MFQGSRRMRRRARLGEGRLRLERRRPLRAAALRVLERAHRLLGLGDAAEAAPLFGQQAMQAEAMGLPARAAQLHLQAARSYSFTASRGPLLDHALRAVALLTAAGDLALLEAALTRLVTELRERGWAAEATEVQQAVERALGTPAPRQRPALPASRLPTTCAQCGGPVRSDEVEWIDEVSAACSYCGCVLSTE
jgi:hypothetical protein